MKIALLGDMAFYGRYSAMRGPATFEYFGAMAAYLSGFDHVIGNLETPLCEGLDPRGHKSAYICATARDAELLRFLNIDIVNLANNHIFDYGREGYEQTLKALTDNNIAHFGIDGAEVQLTDASAKVALHGYCSFNTNPLGSSRHPGVGLNLLNVATLRGKMIEYDRGGFLNIVSIHSGQEHVHYPSLDDIKMARLLSEDQPYVYYGHHPHVTQGYEVCNDALIAYSLGNFCFDDVYTEKSTEPLVKQSEDNKTGLIVELEIEGKGIVNYKMRPIFAGAKSLVLDPAGALSNLELYSAGLHDEAGVYISRRNALISDFLTSRKNMRDINWYLRRLNANSVGIILRAKYNQYQYRRNVSRYLEKWK